MLDVFLFVYKGKRNKFWQTRVYFKFQISNLFLTIIFEIDYEKTSFWCVIVCKTFIHLYTHLFCIYYLGQVKNVRI